MQEDSDKKFIYIVLELFLVKLYLAHIVLGL